MKEFSKILDEYFSDLVKELEKSNSEEVIVDIASDLKFNDIFRILMKYFVEYCIERNVLINSFAILKFVPRDNYNMCGVEYADFDKKEYNKSIKEKGYSWDEQIMEGIVFYKSLLYLMLERIL